MCLKMQKLVGQERYFKLAGPWAYALALEPPQTITVSMSRSPPLSVSHPLCLQRSPTLVGESGSHGCSDRRRWEDLSSHHPSIWSGPPCPPLSDVY